MKDRLYSYYGDRCVSCGFGDKRALQIDHINNDGYLERTKNVGGRAMLAKAVAARDKTRYQILCANCNFIKKAEHHKEKYGETIDGKFIPPGAGNTPVGATA